MLPSNGLSGWCRVLFFRLLPLGPKKAEQMDCWGVRPWSGRGLIVCCLRTTGRNRLETAAVPCHTTTTFILTSPVQSARTLPPAAYPARINTFLHTYTAPYPSSPLHPIIPHHSNHSNCIPTYPSRSPRLRLAGQRKLYTHVLVRPYVRTAYCRPRRDSPVGGRTPPHLNTAHAPAQFIVSHLPLAWLGTGVCARAKNTFLRAFASCLVHYDYCVRYERRRSWVQRPL